MLLRQSGNNSRSARDVQNIVPSRYLEILNDVLGKWTEERRYEVLLIQIGEARLRDRKSYMEILSDSGWVRFRGRDLF